MRLMTALAVFVLFVSTASAATVDGLKIHSASAGSGRTTLVLVHGWTCDSSSWAAQVPVLAKKYRVLTLDLPGHGQSGAPKDGKFSMDLFARAVEAVRAEAGTDKIVLVGHSMGAPVIRQYARLYPAARRRPRRRGRPARHAPVPGGLQAAVAHRAPRGSRRAKA